MESDKLAELKRAIEIGLASGIAEPGTFARLRAKYNLPLSARDHLETIEISESDSSESLNRPRTNAKSSD